MKLSTLLSSLGAPAIANAAPHFDHKGAYHPITKNELSMPTAPLPFAPQAKAVTILANVTDPSLTRDSCGSVKLGLRTLWACRDTSLRIPGSDKYGFLFVNSVGWTEQSSDGSPLILKGGPEGAGSTGSNPVVLMKGPRPTLPAFYPLNQDQCAPSGKCNDGTSRWVRWPDSPPMVTDIAMDGTITAYTWIANVHMESSTLAILNPQGSTALHKLTYKPTLDENVIPTVTVVNEAFWNDHEIGYGVYGNVANDGYAYLYGLTDPRAVALARVALHSIENKAAYEYLVNGVWTSSMPAINDTAATVPNAGTTGQGTYYYDNKHQSFVWIGQPHPAIWADFYIATAPSPQGPWTQPYKLWSGPNGDGELPAYSLQSHPHYLRPQDDGIYVTWTQTFQESTNPAVYITPIAYISFV